MLLRSQTGFTAKPINTANNGLKSWRYLGPKIWHIIPSDIRNSGNTEELKIKPLKIILLSYVLITSATLSMSISHISGASHSEVLWKIERGPILAGDFKMAASALKCYS